jgi:hypothetical protein
MHRLLQYVAHHPNATTTFRPSNMQLTAHSDASYHSESGARSRAACYFFLGPDHYQGIEESSVIPKMNGCVHFSSTIIPTVCASGVEAEYAALFLTGQAAEPIRQALFDLGYPQAGPTPIIYDNEISGKIAQRTCNQRRSKPIAMRYHWIQDRLAQGHLSLRWREGKFNLADLFTKAHPVNHFIKMSKFYISYVSQ